MRPLASNEKILLLLLFGALFVAVNMMGLHAFLQARTGMEKAIVKARSALASDKSWVEQGKALNPADAWINAHPMPRLTPDEASAQLLKTERDEAEKAGLKVIEENILPSGNTPYGYTVIVFVKLTGPFEGVIRMLFALQSPTSWRTMEKLALKSDAQPPNVVAELELHQYFEPTTAAGSTVKAPTP